MLYISNKTQEALLHFIQHMLILFMRSSISSSSSWIIELRYWKTLHLQSLISSITIPPLFFFFYLPYYWNYISYILSLFHNLKSYIHISSFKLACSLLSSTKTTSLPKTYIKDLKLSHYKKNRYFIASISR